MRKLLLCGGFALALAGGAAAAPDKEQWDVYKSDQDIRLFYGVPESEAVTLSFICEPKRKRITIVSAVLPPGTHRKRLGRIKLSNGSSSLEYAGKTEPDRNDPTIYFFTASTSVDPRLFAFLETGTSLEIESLGARESVPLAGIKAPLARMRETCR
jgi:hypothetical protein